VSGLDKQQALQQITQIEDQMGTMFVDLAALKKN
jgi:hypothetical protein